MSAYDEFLKEKTPAVSQPVQQTVAPQSILSKVGSFFGDIFKSKASTPAPAPMPAPTPTPKPSTAYGAFQSQVKQPVKSAYDEFKASTGAKSVESPYFYTKTPSGATIGRSDQLDTSGKPLFAYRNPGDTSTTTDKTRIATTFDPSKAQPLTREQYYNPRAEGLRKTVGDKLGIKPSQELDHAIALTVGGSNQPENLRAISIGANQEAGQFEFELARQLQEGKISYFEAQIKDAEHKGVKTPWTPPEPKKNITFGDIFGNDVSATGGRDLTGLSKFIGKVITPPSQETVGKEPSQFKRTLALLPSELTRNLPLGVGSIVQQLQDDPETATNLDWSTVVKSLPDAGKEFVKGFFVSPVLSVAGGVLFPLLKNNGAITVNIPGLGEVSNLQADVASRALAGEPLWQSILTETPNAIFSTLMFTGMVEKTFGARQVTVAKGTAPEGGITVAEAPKTGRLYNPPITTKPIPTNVLENIAKEQGFTLGKKYDPQSPTYFRMTGNPTTGAVTGEIVQIKPSYFKTFMGKFKGDASQAPAEAIIPLYSKPIKLSDITDAASKAYETIKNTPNKEGGFIAFQKEKGIATTESKSGKELAVTAQKMGSDQGGVSDWLAKEISKEDYTSQTVNIDELVKSDKDLQEYLQSTKGKVRPFKSGNITLPPILKSNGEVLDGYNRIAQAIKNGEATIQVYKGKLSPAAEAPKYTGESNLSTKTLQKLEGRSTVSKQFISDLTNAPDLKQNERDIIRQVLNEYPDGKDVPVKEFADKVKTELLPLKVLDSKAGGRYESITLPNEQRGNVANYKERIYQSPVKTSAGSTHFGDYGFDEEGAPKNYFGHTRVEDMAPDNYVDKPRLSTGQADFEREAKALQDAGTTRRIIEVQSDLYQKGNLESEKSSFGTHVTYEGKMYTIDGGKNGLTLLKDSSGKVIEVKSEKVMPLGDQKENFAMKGNEVIYKDKTYTIKETQNGRTFATLEGKDGETLMNIHTSNLSPTDKFNTAMKRAKELSKLQQYSNPTAHFRMVREEVKQAAIDGKTKLQFPTGETAMKIEGLSRESFWYDTDAFNKVKDAGPVEGVGGMELLNRSAKLDPKTLKVGQGITDNSGSEWIITDVLGDGKFKAVEKDFRDSMKGRWLDMEGDKNWESRLESHKESFDISGKVDTNNPIYKFYEKELGRYLKSNYDAKIVTDKQGVTWHEVDIKPDMAKKPVTAFNRPLLNKDLQITKDQAREIIFKGVDPADLKLFFTKELIDGATGGFTQDPVLGNIIALYEKDGKVGLVDAIHESKHYLFTKLTPEIQREAFAIAKEEMGPLYRKTLETMYEKSGKYEGPSRESALLEEYIVDKWSKSDASGMGYKKSVYGKIFEALDKLLKRFIDAIKKIKANWKNLPNKKGGFAKVPFGEELNKKIREKKGITEDPRETLMNAEKRLGVTEKKPILPPKKSQFVTPKLRDLSSTEQKYAKEVADVLSGKSETGSVGEVPKFMSQDGKSRTIEISQSMAKAIQRDHGKIGIENMIINANDWNLAIKNFDKNPDKINLIKEIPESKNHFVLSAIRTNGFYTLTHYEVKPERPNELKRLLSRGDVLDRSGRTPSVLADSLHVNSSNEERSSLGRISGVESVDRSNITKPILPVKRESATSEKTVTLKADREDRLATEKSLKEMKKIEAKAALEDRLKIKLPTQLESKAIELAIRKEALDANPMKSLVKFMARAGEFKGHLPEVTGGLGKGKFARVGDRYISEATGINDSEQARAAFDKYMETRKSFEKDMAKFVQEKNDFLKQARGTRDEIIANQKIGRMIERTDKHISQILGDEATRKARIERIKQKELETQQKLKDIQAGRARYNNLVEAAHLNEQQKKSLLAKFKTYLSPISQTDKTTQQIYIDWESSKVKGKEEANKTYEKYAGHAGGEMPDIIEYEAGANTPWIRDLFDDLFAEAKSKDLDFRYKDNYIPHVYRERPEQIKQAIVKYMKDKQVDPAIIKDYEKTDDIPEKIAIKLKINPSFTKIRTFPDYKTAMKYNLTPRLRTVAEHAAYYVEEMNKTVANRKLIADLIKEGKVLDGMDAPESWVEIKFPGRNFRQYYGPKDLADSLNGQFRGDENLTGLQTVLKYGAETSKLMQEIALSAGIPNTNINFFSVGQAVKMLTTGVGEAAKLNIPGASTSVKAAYAFIRANFNNQSIKFLKENQKYIDLMASQNISLGKRVGDYTMNRNTWKQLLTSSSVRDLKVAAKNTAADIKSIRSLRDVGKTAVNFAESSLVGIPKAAFDNLFNQKTFNSFMPQMQVQVFKDIYNRAISAGADENFAAEFAAKTIKAEFGLIDALGRTKTTQNALSSLFFAPKFREGIVNIFKEGARSYSTQFKNAAYGRSRSFVIGLIVTFAAYNLINQQLNDGDSMWDNEAGHEFDLKIPMSNGRIIYTPFMPSILSFVRNMGSSVFAFSKGDAKTGLQKAGTLFSMLVQAVTETVSNKDYFGRPIYEMTDSPAVKARKALGHLGLNLVHPYFSEFYKYFSGKQDIYQTLSIASELPIKFSTQDKAAISDYYEAQRAKTEATAIEKKRMQPIFEQVQQLVSEGNSDRAQDIVNGLSDTDYAIYKKLKSAAISKESNATKIKVTAIYQNVQKLISKGKTDEATALVNDLTDNEYKAYQAIKKADGQ